MKRPDKKDFTIETETAFVSGIVEYAYINALEKYIDHLEQMYSSDDIHHISECDHDYVEDVSCGVNLWVCSKCGDTN